MAKSGVFEGDPAMLARALELKKELQKLVQTIADDDDVNLEAVERAQRMLCALKEFKLKKSVSLSLRDHHYGQGMVAGPVPEEFKCPLSKELMRDPVIIASGQTFDRPFIQKWLKSGNRTCPRTQQVLSHTILTPNHLIPEMIAEWCKNHGIKLPDSVHYTNEEGLTEADRDHFLSLLKKMSSTLADQKEAAKELRLLTKRMPSFRALFSESLGAIPQLLSPFAQSKCKSELHPDLQEDLITTILNLSIHDNNKKLVAETPMVIPLLMDTLRSGTIETRSNAAAALFTLSALDSNKALIGKSGALKPLIDLLDEGYPLAMKDVASAIFSLCIIHENKARAVRDGAPKGYRGNGRAWAVPCLFSIIRETSCARNKENCIAILYTICFNDRSKWKEMREEESMHHTISQLAQNGTSRAKRKASGILERLNRVVNLTHTA
ncbi:UNVERIFIED_CONTAM: U-box domain-containing protein 9 [Sesamum latifolium]|uniref:RING-type E3 ubiquitin transferase n=1 Tax=Sesamum latifolium TaxID=2727402 RepID=A0AAW2Y3W0_9LAMI